MKIFSEKGGPRRAYNLIGLGDLKKFVVYWFPILAYCGLIYLQSAYPSPENVPHLPFFDKLVHVAAYALLGILFFRAYRTTRLNARLKTVMLISIVSSAVYGVSDEIHQHFVPFRQADFLDVLADLLGSVFGVYVYQFVLSKQRVSSRDRAEKR